MNVLRWQNILSLLDGLVLDRGKEDRTSRMLKFSIIKRWFRWSEFFLWQLAPVRDTTGTMIIIKTRVFKNMSCPHCPFYPVHTFQRITCRTSKHAQMVHMIQGTSDSSSWMTFSISALCHFSALYSTGRRHSPRFVGTSISLPGDR